MLSAHEHPEVVQAYLHKELLAGRMLGPFAPDDLGSLPVLPGCKGSREARYYAKTRAFASFYAIISRGARGYVRRRNFARSRVKIISTRQFKGAHERCVKAARPFTRIHACSRAISRVSMVNTFEV